MFAYFNVNRPSIFGSGFKVTQSYTELCKPQRAPHCFIVIEKVYLTHKQNICCTIEMLKQELEIYLFMKNL